MERPSTALKALLAFAELGMGCTFSHPVAQPPRFCLPSKESALMHQHYCRSHRGDVAVVELG